MLAARAHSLAAEAKTLVEADSSAAAGSATQPQEVKSTLLSGSGSGAGASSSAGAEPPSKRQRVEAAASATTAATAPSPASRRLSVAVLSSFDRWKQSVPLLPADLLSTLEQVLRSRLDAGIEPLPDRLTDKLPARLVSVICSYLSFRCHARFATCSKAMSVAARQTLAWTLAVEIPFSPELNIDKTIALFGDHRPRKLRLSLPSGSRENVPAPLPLLRALGSQLESLESDLSLPSVADALPDCEHLTSLVVPVEQDELSCMRALSLPQLRSLALINRAYFAITDPMDLGGLPSLTALDLGRGFVRIHMDRFLQQLKPLAQLRTLGLSTERDVIGLEAGTQLETLHLHLRRRLNEDDTERVRQLTQLTSLQIEAKASSLMRCALPAAASLPRLRVLKLQQTGAASFAGVDFAAGSLPSTLIELHLECGAPSAINPGVAASFASLTSLERLMLSGRLLEPFSAQLPRLPRLRSLGLGLPRNDADQKILFSVEPLLPLLQQSQSLRVVLAAGDLWVKLDQADMDAVDKALQGHLPAHVRWRWVKKRNRA